MLEEKISKAIDAGLNRQMLERKLLNAIDAGEEDVVEQIIAAGVKVDFDFNSPICRAALAGHVDIVHRLHVAGCRIDVPGVGSKVLKFAVWGNHPEVIDYLLEQGVRPPLEGKPLLKIAAREGSADAFEKLADFGVRLDDLEEDILEAAEKGGSERILRRLLESNESLRTLALTATSMPLSQSIAAQIKLSLEVCKGGTNARIPRRQT